LEDTTSVVFKLAFHELPNQLKMLSGKTLLFRGERLMFSVVPPPRLTGTGRTFYAGSLSWWYTSAIISHRESLKERLPFVILSVLMVKFQLQLQLPAV